MPFQTFEITPLLASMYIDILGWGGVTQVIKQSLGVHVDKNGQICSSLTLLFFAFQDIV